MRAHRPRCPRPLLAVYLARPASTAISTVASGQLGGGALLEAAHRKACRPTPCRPARPPKIAPSALATPHAVANFNLLFQAEGRWLLALLLLLLLPSPRAVRASFACAAIGRRASREPRGPRGLSCNGSVEPVEPPTLAVLGPNHPARPATSPTPTCHDRLQPRWKTQIVMCARQVCRSVEMTIISFRIPGPELPMRNLCCQPAETAADDSSLLVARQ